MTIDRLTHDAASTAADHLHGGWPFRRSAAQRYGVAVLAVTVAFALRYAVYGDLQNRIVFTFFVPAALVAAWYGGLGPGILATVLGLLLGDFFFLPPRLALWPLDTAGIRGITVFTVTTSVCVALCENLHRYIRRLEHALEQARHQPHSTP